MSIEIVEIQVGQHKEFISGLYSTAFDSNPTERSKTLVIMTHDFPGGHKEAEGDLFGDIEFLFNDLGFNTLRFDFRGFGASEGKEEDLTLARAGEDLKVVMAWAEMQGFEKLIFIGAGLSSAVCLQNINEKVGMLFLFWPVSDLEAFAKQRLQADSLSTEAYNKGYVTVDGHRVGVALIKELLGTNLFKDMETLKIPILIQHGVQDEMVSIEHTDKIKNNVRARRIDITSYQDGTHGLPDEKHRKMISFHICQFIDKYA